MNYFLICPLGEAEIKALENTRTEILSEIFPVFELTRGRKIRDRNYKSGTERYPFDKRLEKIKDIFKGRKVAFDLTSDENLSNNKIEDLYNPQNGYHNWITFLLDIKNENCFNEIIPTILINAEDENFDENLKLQVSKLYDNFDTVIYRNSLYDKNCYSDLNLLKDIILGKKFTFLLDCSYVSPASQNAYIDTASDRINNILKMNFTNFTYIVAGTSFPNNISKIGQDKEDEFKLVEIDIYENVKKNTQLDNLLYGDYGSINPIRNDGVTMARGWIPRIDVPLERKIYYCRERRPRGVKVYLSTYKVVADKVTSKIEFPWDLKKNWGIQQILKCVQGENPAGNPGGWIAIRMNIHLEQQVNRVSNQ